MGSRYMTSTLKIMATPDTNPVRLNDSIAVTAYDPQSTDSKITITSLLKGGKVAIDRKTYTFSGPIEFYSPISCSSFVAAAVGQVAFISKGPLYPYALLMQYNNFALTGTTYNFGSLEGGADAEGVEAGLISDYATAGIDIARLGTMEDLIADEDIMTGLGGINNLTNTCLKTSDPSKLDGNSSNDYWYEGSYSCLPGPGCYPSPPRQRGFFLQAESDGYRHLRHIPPYGPEDWTLLPWTLALFIKSWNSTYKCLVKLN